MQAPIDSAWHPQVPADVQHAVPSFARQEGHGVPLHVPPPDPDDPEEVELFGATQLRPLHTWLVAVQSLHN